MECEFVLLIARVRALAALELLGDGLPVTADAVSGGQVPHKVSALRVSSVTFWALKRQLQN